MGRIYIPPKVNVDRYGRVNVLSKSTVEFEYLIGMSVSDVVLFDHSNEELLSDSGTTVLPRHYSIFVGTNDGEIQYKPYEYDAHRIVVSTYKGIITTIDSIG